MGATLRLLRRATRSLFRVPLFALACILTLTLGIGATTAVFSVVNAILLKPLPYDGAERLVSLSHTLVISGLSNITQADATLLFYRRHNTSFSHVGGYQASAANLGAMLGASRGSTTEAERVPAGRLSADVLTALRVTPLTGRVFSEQDDTPGQPAVVLISEPLWTRKYGADPGILDRRLEIDGVPHDVIGVMRADFRFPAADTALWLPLRLDPAHTESAMFVYDGLGRLRDGVTLEAAAADLRGLLPRLPDEFPGRMTTASIAQTRMQPVVQPLHDVVVGDIGTILWVVLGAVAFVLAIACANVANLFLVRAEGRHKEIAVQRALGASSWNLVATFLSEALVVTAMGGALGVGGAWLALGVLRRMGAAVDVPRLAEVELDTTALAVAVVCIVGAAVFVSLYPALRGMTAAVSTVLTSTSRSSTNGKERHRVRHALVAAQVALALVLLVGSGLMARSLWRLKAIDPGFDAARALTFRMALPEATYRTSVDASRFFVRAIDAIHTVGGVEAAGAISKIPLDEQGRTDSAVFVEDRPIPAGGLPGIHPVHYATPRYFDAAGIPVVAGRTFGAPDPPRVVLEALVSQAFAERYWPRESALGKRVRIYTNGPWYSVVGVVGDVRGAALSGPPDQAVYCPLVPAPDDPRWLPRDMAFVVRGPGDPAAMSNAIRSALAVVDSSLPIYRVRALADVVSLASARTAFTFVLLAAASTVALLLGALGLYGVLSYVVSLRVREMGIRLALGARPADVRRMVARQALRVATAGVAVGLAAALGLTRVLASLLYEVRATDPLVLGGAAALLLVVALAAAWLPARRAAAVDPAIALRAE